LQRLRAVRKLRDAGINAGVLMAPVVPGFTTQTSKLDATIKAVADHGAAFMGANVLYLKGGTKDHFMGFLAHAFPHMVDSYQRLYAGAYAPSEYVGTVRALVDMLQERYKVNQRVRRVKQQEEDAPDNEPGAPEQREFRW
jgi:DNA repair photolyase